MDPLFPEPLPRADEPTGIAHEGFKRVLFLGWSYVAAYVGIDLYFGAPIAGALTLVAAVGLFPATYLLYRRGQSTAAHFALMFSLTYSVLVGQTFLGQFAGFIFYFTPLATLPVLLFRSCDRRRLLAAMAIPLLGWFFGETQPIHQLAQPYLPIAFPLATFHFVNFLSGFALTMIFLGIYVRAIYEMNLAQTEAADRARLDLERAFQRLAVSERSFADMFNGMAEGVIIQDRTGKLLKINRAAARILNVDPEQQINPFAQAFRVCAADGRPLAPDDLPSRVALRTARPQRNVELTIHRRDGETRFLKVNAIPYESDGTVAYAVSTFTDVTEEKESQSLLHQIVNGAPDFIYIKDRAHRYLSANDSYAAAMGLTPGEVIGRSDAELGLLSSAEVFNKVLATGKPQSFDSGELVIGGIKRTFHTVKVPLYRPDAEHAFGVVTFSRDVTELKDAERRLAETSQMAALGLLAGGIAHEINNPLAIISGKVAVLTKQIAREQIDRAGAQDALVKINSTVDRIARIIRGLKAISRNGDEDPFEALTFRQVVDDALAFCEERFRAQGVSLIVDLIPDVAMTGSPAQLSQVLINLLNNAHDAVEGTDENWVHLGFTVEIPGRVGFVVTNGGPRIPDDVADRLAQPFFTTKPSGKGTGLGLTLSQKIVHRHGGTLQLDRLAPHTRFVVDLPLAAGQASPRAA